MDKKFAGILRRKRWRNMPILLAFEVGGQLCVWCPFCKKFHYHGPPEGHRAAHCGDNRSSPFQKTGYMVIKFSSWTRKNAGEGEKEIIRNFTKKEKRG